MVRSRWASLPVPHNTINQQYSADIIIHARERGRKQGEKEKENMANSPAFNEANLVCFGVSKCSSHRQKKRKGRKEEEKNPRRGPDRKSTRLLKGTCFVGSGYQWI